MGCRHVRRLGNWQFRGADRQLVPLLTALCFVGGLNKFHAGWWSYLIVVYVSICGFWVVRRTARTGGHGRVACHWLARARALRRRRLLLHAAAGRAVRVLYPRAECRCFAAKLHVVGCRADRDRR